MQTGTHTFCFDDKSLVVGKTSFRESKRTEQKHCRTLTLWMMSRAPFSAWILFNSVQNKRFGEDLHPASLKHIHHFLQMWQSETTRKCRMFECEMTQICNRTLPRLLIEELKLSHGWFWTYFWMSLGQFEAHLLRRQSSSCLTSPTDLWYFAIRCL